MSESRKAIIMSAFRKMDRTGDGVITVADLKGYVQLTTSYMYYYHYYCIARKYCLEKIFAFFAPCSHVYPTIYYPVCMHRGKVIGLSVSLSVCHHLENRHISTSRHLSSS